MRPSFRVLLPAAQTALTIATALSNFAAPQFRMASLCDWDPSAICTPFFSATIVRLVEINLPALPVLAPLYLWLGDSNHPNPPLLLLLFGLAGIGIWFFVGQFLDDVVESLRQHRGPRRRIHCALPFVFITIASCAVFIESDVVGVELSSSESAIRTYSLCWLAFGCTGLLSQICFSAKGEFVGGFIARHRS